MSRTSRRTGYWALRDALGDRGGRGYVFDLDKLDISGEVPKPGRLATEVARAWRSGDLRHIDVVSELADSLVAADGQSRQGRGGRHRRGRALGRYVRREPVDSDGVSLLVTVLDRAPDCLPEKVWRTLAADSGQDFRLELAAWRNPPRGPAAAGMPIGSVACLRRALQDPACRRDLRDPGRAGWPGSTRPNWRGPRLSGLARSVKWLRSPGRWLGGFPCSGRSGGGRGHGAARIGGF